MTYQDDEAKRDKKINETRAFARGILRGMRKNISYGLSAVGVVIGWHIQLQVEGSGYSIVEDWTVRRPTLRIVLGLIARRRDEIAENIACVAKDPDVLHQRDFEPADLDLETFNHMVATVMPQLKAYFPPSKEGDQSADLEFGPLDKYLDRPNDVRIRQIRAWDVGEPEDEAETEAPWWLKLKTLEDIEAMERQLESDEEP